MWSYFLCSARKWKHLKGSYFRPSTYIICSWTVISSPAICFIMKKSRPLALSSSAIVRNFRLPCFHGSIGIGLARAMINTLTLHVLAKLICNGCEPWWLFSLLQYGVAFIPPYWWPWLLCQKEHLGAEAKLFSRNDRFLRILRVSSRRCFDSRALPTKKQLCKKNTKSIEIQEYPREMKW